MPTLTGVLAEVDKINKSGVLPAGVRIERIYDRSALVDITTHTVLHNMVMGVLLIFAIQWLFLGDLRSALIVSATIPFALLFAVVILLLITGQTIIFLLRLVAADRRSRRRPLASATKTVGELEDASLASAGDEPRAPAGDEPRASAGDEPRPSAGDEPLAAAADVAAATPPATPPSGDPGIDEPPPSDRGPVRQ
jgi:hypothetical protein